MVVLPSSTQPASRTRAEGGASGAAGAMSPAAVPSGVGTPFVPMLSLMVIGTPSMGLSGSPARQRGSALVAFACATAASIWYLAVFFGILTTLGSSIVRV